MATRKCQKKEILLAVSCLLLGLATLTFYIWHQSALIGLGYQIAGLEMTIDQLRIEIKKLETEKAALLSPERVEKIARTLLNLGEPKEGQILYQTGKDHASDD